MSSCSTACMLRSDDALDVGHTEFLRRIRIHNEDFRPLAAPVLRRIRVLDFGFLLILTTSFATYPTLASRSGRAYLHRLAAGRLVRLAGKGTATPSSAGAALRSWTCLSVLRSRRT